ncbi:SDR family NAD(P)-dependent oxidoreductase [candidate division KSB1 bacterium]
MNEAMFRLEGKVALVTGSATGIGQSISIALAKQGADIAISDMREVSLDETAEKTAKYGHKIYQVGIDVRSINQIKKSINAVLAEFGRIDILVNNAGINRPAVGLDVIESDWDDIFNTNVKGGFFMSQVVARTMIEKKWGRIIFISSQAGIIGIPGQSTYCSSKGAVIQLARTLGLEWAKYGITVNTVAPTVVETNLNRERLKNPQFLKFILDKIPAGKLATKEDMAAAVVYLASEEARMVNCTTLLVDGGYTAW